MKETSGGLYASPAEAGSTPFNIHVGTSSLQTVMMMFSRQTSNAVFAGDFTHIPGKQISLTFFKFLTFFVLFISMQILTFALVIFLEEKNALRLFTEKKNETIHFLFTGTLWTHKKQ